MTQPPYQQPHQPPPYQPGQPYQQQPGYRPPYPPQQQPKKKRWPYLLVIPGLIVFALTRGGDDPDRPATPASAPVTPAYTVVSDEQDLVRVAVDALPAGDGLRTIFDAVRATKKQDGGYFVQINCSTGGTDQADNRLANGRFAVGALGAAQTGLKPGAAEFEAEAGRTCPAGPPETLDPSIAAAVGIPPKPDAATQAAYLAALRAINPDIIGRHDDSIIVGRGRDQCRSIKDHPSDRARQIQTTKIRFSAGGYPDGFPPDQLERILDVVHQYLCPTF